MQTSWKPLTFAFLRKIYVSLSDVFDNIISFFPVFIHNTNIATHVKEEGTFMFLPLSNFLQHSIKILHQIRCRNRISRCDCEQFYLVWNDSMLKNTNRIKAGTVSRTIVE